MRETEFERRIVDELKQTYPGAYVLKIQPFIQGFPDRLFLYSNFWAALEFKRLSNSRFQANQKYYLRDLNRLSFARLINPENANEVLNELHNALSS